MENETNPSSPSCCGKKCTKGGNAGISSGAYGLAFIGAAVYYIQHADTFWIGVVGVLKALVWPAFLVHEVLKFLKM